MLKLRSRPNVFDGNLESPRVATAVATLTSVQLIRGPVRRSRCSPVNVLGRPSNIRENYGSPHRARLGTVWFAPHLWQVKMVEVD